MAPVPAQPLPPRRLPPARLLLARSPGSPSGLSPARSPTAVLLAKPSPDGQSLFLWARFCSAPGDTPARRPSARACPPVLPDSHPHDVRLRYATLTDWPPPMASALRLVLVLVLVRRHCVPFPWRGARRCYFALQAQECEQL